MTTQSIEVDMYELKDWRDCARGTINLLSAGIQGGEVGVYEFIDNRDQLWGFAIQWPDTVTTKEVIDMGYRLQRWGNGWLKANPDFSVPFNFKLFFNGEDLRIDAFAISPDFVWSEEAV